MRRRSALAALAAILAAAAALIAVELGRGAPSYGELESRDACAARVGFPGDGADATIQRIAISGLYGAACELGATREELILSFVPSVATAEIRWDRETIARAVRGGLVRAIDDAEARGSLPGFAALILREIVQRAPIDWLLDRAGDLADLFGG
jgi:hypothetical protein